MVLPVKGFGSRELMTNQRVTHVQNGLKSRCLQQLQDLETTLDKDALDNLRQVVLAATYPLRAILTEAIGTGILNLNMTSSFQLLPNTKTLSLEIPSIQPSALHPPTLFILPFLPLHFIN